MTAYKLLIVNCVSDRSELALYQGLAKRGGEITLLLDPRDVRGQELAQQNGWKCLQQEISSRFSLKAILFFILAMQYPPSGKN